MIINFPVYAPDTAGAFESRTNVFASVTELMYPDETGLFADITCTCSEPVPAPCMYVCVCLCVCVYEPVPAPCMCAYKYVCTYAHGSSTYLHHTYACMHTRKHTHGLSTYLRACVHA